MAGSVAPPLAYLMNASNGLLVTVLIGVAGAVWLCPVPLSRRRGPAAGRRSLLPELHPSHYRRAYGAGGTLGEGRELVRAVGRALVRPGRRALAKIAP